MNLVLKKNYFDKELELVVNGSMVITVHMKLSKMFLLFLHMNKGSCDSKFKEFLTQSTRK